MAGGVLPGSVGIVVGSALAGPGGSAGTGATLETTGGPGGIFGKRGNGLPTWGAFGKSIIVNLSDPVPL